MQENIKKVMKETERLEETKHASAFSLNHPKSNSFFAKYRWVKQKDIC